MSWTRRRYQIAAAVPVVMVFATLYAWAVPTEGPNRWVDTFALAALFAMPTVLWLFMSWLLVNQWWERAGAQMSTMDTPGQLLAATVAILPEPRQRWGEAMLGELAQVRGRSARWRFALSCARAVLFLPLPTRRPVLTIAVGVVVAAVAAATHRLVGAALPAFGFFAASFVTVMGVTTVLAIARARRVRLPVPAATVLVTGAVAACIAATATFLTQHPTAAEGFPPDRAAFLAVALAGCLVLAAAPPRRSASNSLAPLVGVGAAAIFTFLGPLVTPLLAHREGLPAIWLLFGPVLTFIVAGYLAAAVGRSFRAGVQAGIWTAIAVMPLTLALGLAMASRQYAVNGVWTFADDVTTAGSALGFAFLTSMAMPIIGLPFAVMGATAGALLRGTPPARKDAPEQMA